VLLFQVESEYLLEDLKTSTAFGQMFVYLHASIPGKAIVDVRG
jgi:hypothetical protein